MNGKIDEIQIAFLASCFIELFAHILHTLVNYLFIFYELSIVGKISFNKFSYKFVDTVQFVGNFLCM